MTTALSVAVGRARGGHHVAVDVPPSVLVQHFDLLVQVAGSVKLLKELILYLAMQGRLSDPQVDTAEALLSEIRRARQRLAAGGMRIRDVIPADDADAPWMLPRGWRWVRLVELGGFLGGGTPSKSNSSFWTGPLPWVSPKDMKQPYIDDAEDHISMAAVGESAAKLIPAGSILCVVRGMILAHSFPVALTRREVTINQDMKALVLAEPALGEFVLRACQAARARVLSNVERSSHGTCRLDGEVVENLLIPLPPLAEQKRIVAKVDQLMALCDDLEARQTKKREIGTRLTKSALEALTTAESPAEFAAAWQRVTENFDLLIDRVEKVSSMRLTIVELAVRGNLAEQRPDDEDAAALLDRIVTERTAASARGMRVPDPAPMEQADGPYSIPARWRWIRWGQLALGADSGWSPQCESRPRDGDEWGVVKVSAVSWNAFRPDENKALPPGEDPRPGCAIHAGDFLMSRANTAELVGRSVIVDVEPVRLMMSDKIVRCTFAGPVCNRYVNLFNQTVSARTHYVANASGTSDSMKNISRDVVFSMPVALPPLAEQHRIVAKVEQLMKICDDLEAKLRRAEDRAAKLVEAAVQELVAS